MQKDDRVVLAAGGTGGHIFPAQAIAEELIDRGYRPFLICDQRGNEFLQGSLAKIDSIKIFAPKPGSSLMSCFINFFKILPIIFRIRRKLKLAKPKAVIGLGGYPSLPTMLAAISLNIPTFIHEQNAVLGRVNRLILPLVNKVFLSFPNTRKLKSKYFNKSLGVGGLIRKEVLRDIVKPIVKDDYFNLLVIGGSQGAKLLTEIVPLSINKLSKEMQLKLRIHQQARPNLIEETKRLYKASKAQVEVKSFFTNIGSLLKSSNLIIARSGTTVMEAAAFGKPAIFVPLKIAIDNHQYYNAKYFEDLGGAIIIEESEFDVQKLSELIEHLMNDDVSLDKMASAMSEFKDYNAASKIVDYVEKEVS